MDTLLTCLRRDLVPVTPYAGVSAAIDPLSKEFHNCSVPLGTTTSNHAAGPMLLCKP
jgi:hypothetical protein